MDRRGGPTCPPSVGASTEATGGSAERTGFTIAASRFESIPGEMRKDVVKGSRAAGHLGLQLIRGAARGDAPLAHNRYAGRQVVGLLHVMGGQEESHTVLLA